MQQDGITIRREGGEWVLECVQTLATPRDDLFPFFADAHNLQELTPSSLRFDILTPRPIPMASGTIIDYRLRVHGIPIRWKTEILDWDPPHQFVDDQRRGPYQRWHHTHTFESDGNGRTRCTDIVRYRPRGGFLAPLVNALFVQRDVRRIFEYRMRELGHRFGTPGRV